MNDSARPLRLVLLYTVPFHSYAEDLAEDVVGAIQHSSPGVEIAHHDVAKMKIFICPGCKKERTTTPCRVNDNADRHYKPEDQFVLIMDSIRKADMVLLVGTLRAGGLNATAQNLLERLDCAANRTPISPLKKKAAGVLLVSTQPNTWSVADRVLGLLNCFGATIPPHAALTVTSAGSTKEGEEDTSSVGGDDDITTAAARDLLGSKTVMDGIQDLADGLVSAAKSFVGEA
jgi:multimeric flavodoxin WrbA